ncbi:MAG: choice-of-anchor Q domain-containing protein [Candidatus Promineifilaceae bacterium]
MNPKRLDETSDVVLAVWQEQLEEAKDKPWLASLLLRQGEQIYRRFAYFYEQLLALPRKTRRLVQKRLATTLVGAALLLALAGPIAPAVHAATITVHPGSTGVNGSDGGCSLVEAILTANTGTYSSGDCSGGTTGPDTITLAGNTYSYNAPYGATMNALPTIDSQITINANNATIRRSGGSNFRVLQVNSGADLTLNNATISGGNVPWPGSGTFSNYYGGGIKNLGTLAVNNSTISNNSAGWGGGVFSRAPGGGSATLINCTISGNLANQIGAGVYSGGNGTTTTIESNTISGNGNGSTVDGGGIYGLGGTIKISHSIVSGNTASGANEIYNWFSTIYANDYNLFGDSSHTNAQAFYAFTPGTNDFTATSDGTIPTAIGNILNTALANNGTVPHTFTHALVSGSPAIDNVPEGFPGCYSGISVDQRGAARAGGTDKGGVYCDIGAFEYGSTLSPTAVTIEGLMARGEGQAGTAVVGVTGVMALLTGGWLAGVRRRKAK